jgi:hypothetical protein
LVKSSGGLTILNGGTATIRNAKLTSSDDDSIGGDTGNAAGWSGIDAKIGSTLSIDSSLLKNASVAIQSNGYADVSATGSTFNGNAWDIMTTYKDLPGNSAVDAHGSSVHPPLVSVHEHVCSTPPGVEPVIVFAITIYDVEYGPEDGTCPPLWVESKPH